MISTRYSWQISSSLLIDSREHLPHMKCEWIKKHQSHTQLNYFYCNQVFTLITSIVYQLLSSYTFIKSVYHFNIILCVIWLDVITFCRIYKVFRIAIALFASGDHIKFSDRIMKAINTLLFLMLLVTNIAKWQQEVVFLA